MAEHTAVLLINHGSRQPHAAVFAEELAGMLRRDEPARTVAISFLELNEPTPGQALRQLVRGGRTNLRVVPLLFSAGYHYRIDVPAALDAVWESHPRIQVRIAAPLLVDSDEELIDALDARLSETTSVATPQPAANADGLVLLAAGSSDHRARAGVAALAYNWGLSHGLPAEVAFCDLRGDEVRTAIALLHARGARRVACGSLFLATGRLLEAGRRAAFEAGAKAVAGPMGMTPALVALIRRRCYEPVAAG